MQTADYAIVIAFLGISLAAGLIWSQHAGRSLSDFFLSGRKLPWWLAGVSMAATNFSIDTPLGITRYVAESGIGGLWFVWGNAISTLLAAFLFARLWRRAEVITDVELIELRYSGRPAAALRLFKGVYFGLFLNCYVLGWNFKAVVKVTEGVTDIPVAWALGVTVAVALAYTLASGLTGVVWSDLFQYAIAQVGTVLLAVVALREAGGLSGLRAGLERCCGSAEAAMAFLPRFGGDAAMGTAGFQFKELGVSAFLTFVLMQWWAHKYTDGGGKHIQRMMACRSEGHAQGATLFFAIVNNALQIWPWALTALCALVVLGPLPDPEMGYPLLMRLLPTGALGLLVATMLGAFMSTVDTQLNLGAAYLVNDLYKRFLRPNATPRHYVRVSRLAMLVLLGGSVGIALAMESIGNSYRFLVAFVGGAGLVWIVRWFWWRVNAWSEISAMLASGITTIVLYLLDPQLPYTDVLVRVVAASTLAWVPVTLLTAPADEQTLLTFVKRVRPGSPGWRAVTVPHGIVSEPFLGRGLGDWAVGLVFLFALNFAVGSTLFGAMNQAMALYLLAAASGALLLRRLLGRQEPVAA